MLLLTPFVSYSQTDTICLTKEQAIRLANTLDSLKINLNECMIQKDFSEKLSFDLINENVALIEKAELSYQNNMQLDSIIKIQEDLIFQTNMEIIEKESEIKKHKRKFKILGIGSGSAVTLLLLLLLI